MAVIEKWYDQDLSKTVSARVIGNLYYQNANSLKIGVRVYKNGAAVALDGSITGYCVLSDGTTVPVSGTRSGNTAYITLPPSAYSMIGLIYITIVNTSNRVVTTLLACGGVVVKSRTSQTTPSQAVIDDWTNQISEAMQEVVDEASSVQSTLNQCIAVPYESLTFPVEVGTYCIRNYMFYRCKTRIAASENWTASHWTATNVGLELANVSDLIDVATVAETQSYLGLA